MLYGKEEAPRELAPIVLKFAQVIGRCGAHRQQRDLA
jgi:hypothetical protein